MPPSSSGAETTSRGLVQTKARPSPFGVSRRKSDSSPLPGVGVASGPRVVGFFPSYNSDSWGSHICLSLCEHMAGPGLPIELLVPASDPQARRSFTRDCVPNWLRRAVYRVDRTEKLSHVFARRGFRRALENADLAYLWAGVPRTFFAIAEAAGIPFVLERINCHRRTAHRILAEAYARVRLQPPHDEARAHAERADEEYKLERADFVFAPSPLVAESLLDAGIDAGKILRSSYGWSPRRIRPQPPRPVGRRQFTVAFVGSLCVRKGTHLLLEAWAAAALPHARLLLAGRLDSDIATLCADHLRRSDVRHMGHLTDVNAVFALADAFVFPTLEEGSPLVVYEAMAHGLPVLTTPMGAGEVVRDDREGLVRTPYDHDAWVEDLRRLARDHDLRQRLGQAAQARAGDYTWDKVGARRRAQLLAAFGAQQPHAQ